MPSTFFPPFADRFETERLLIRVPRHGDGAIVNAAVRESFDKLHRWMDWARHIPTVAESETISREAAARFRTREELPMYLFRKTDGEFVGASGLHSIEWSVPRFEIGYWVRSTMEGRGYVTEAVVGIAQFAFQSLKAERVEIRCDASNERSAAVAHRAGFLLEARLRHHRRDVNGALTDTLLFAKFPDT